MLCFCYVAYAVSIMLAEQTSTITEKLNTDLSSKDSFFPSTEAVPVNRQVPLTDGRTERERIREQIEYKIMRDRYGQEQIDELVEIMLEVAMNRSPTIRRVNPKFCVNCKTWRK